MLGILLTRGSGVLDFLLVEISGSVAKEHPLEVLRRTILSKESAVGEDGSLSGKDDSDQGETNCRYELQMHMAQG